MAGCLARVADGHVVTSILNTRDEEMKIVAPVVSVEEYMDEKTVEASESTQKRNSKCRDERVWEQLRTEHLNPEEQESLRKVCADYPDVFYIIKAAPMP
jgi:chorismate synthase